MYLAIKKLSLRGASRREHNIRRMSSHANQQNLRIPASPLYRGAVTRTITHVRADWSKLEPIFHVLWRVGRREIFF